MLGVGGPGRGSRLASGPVRTQEYDSEYVSERILLAADGSEDAALAARVAVELSNRVGSELYVVHAWRSVPSAHFEAFLRIQFEQEAREVLDGQVERIEEAGGKVAGRACARGRRWTRSLSSSSLEPDLLVTGSGTKLVRGSANATLASGASPTQGADRPDPRSGAACGMTFGRGTAESCKTLRSIISCRWKSGERNSNERRSSR